MRSIKAIGKIIKKTISNRLHSTRLATALRRVEATLHGKHKHGCEVHDKLVCLHALFKHGHAFINGHHNGLIYLVDLHIKRAIQYTSFGWIMLINGDTE